MPGTRRPRRLTPLVVVLAALAACAAPATAPSASGRAAGADAESPPRAEQSAPLQALLEGARKEGTLSLVWGEGTIGGNEGVRRLADGFNRYYGLNLNVAFTPGPSMSNVVTRLIQEYQADRPATTDIFIGYGDHIAPLARAGALAAVDWPSWASNIPSADLVAGGGVAVPIQSSVNGITYNSSRVRPDEVPHSLQDLLQPRYRGRIAGQNAVAGFDQLAMPDMWGEPRVREYLAQYADQVAGVIRCNEKERIVSGEFDLFALDCNHGNAFTLKQQGAPIDFMVASDAPLLKPLYVGVPTRAAHPNAARLWVNYLLGREAQDVMYALTSMDYHRLPGSRTTADVQRLETGVTRFDEGDLAFYLRVDEEQMEKLRAELIRVLKKS